MNAPIPGSAGVDLSQLPEWAREALAASRSVPDSAAAGAAGHRGAPEWPLLVEAAVVSAFLPRELAPGMPGDAAARAEAERAVLEFAETMQTPQGLRWSLTRDARTAVIGAALGSPELAAAVERTRGAFPDPVSEAVRACVQNPSTDRSLPDDPGAAEAMRVAVAWLSGISGLPLPPLEAVDREIELRRLLSHFERMVGSVRGAGPSARPDRFFGRAGEMETLRAYVGVIEADSWGATVKRIAQGVVRTLKGRAPLAVWGVGGVGKTTLMAKFMLDHARVASSRFPFAYLDFDRGTVSARNPATLLAEMCTQVGAQFAELSGPLGELRDRVRSEARSVEAQGEPVSFLPRHAARFREVVDGYLDGVERRLEWARPFLLVFDTFEVVQYSPEDVQRLEDFVLAFSGGSDDSLWPRLRLVIAGRRQVDEFVRPVEALELGALDPKGSAEMLMALADDAEKPITRKDADRLVAAIARGLRSKERGVHPLRLRLVGEVFKEKGTGEKIAESLRAELAAPPSDDGIVGRLLVDGILVRRVLGHVNDTRVRALADPGLVVRRITPAVIRQVMALGTPRPGGPQDPERPRDPARTESAEERRDREDPAVVEPWEIGEDEAKDIFAAFGREVSLVTPDGEALRHRQDVRQEMLPLIQARRPRRFAALHRLAFDYFRGRAREDPNDHASAGEAIYHGLWLGEPLAKLDGLWRDDPAFDPRLDADEFEAGTPAHVYVRARLGDRLQAREIGVLPHAAALAWLSARSEKLLAELAIDEAVDAIRVAAGQDYEGLDHDPATAAVVARLLYRAGQWGDAVALVDRHLEPVGVPELALVARRATARSLPNASRGDAALVSLARTMGTLAGKSGASPFELQEVLQVGLAMADPLLRVEALAHVELGAPGAHPGLRDEIGRTAHAVAPDRWPSAARILRLAALTADGDVRDLLAAYFALGRPLPRDRALRPHLARIFAALGERRRFSDGESATLGQALEGDDEKQGLDALDALAELWRQRVPEVLDAVRARPELTPALRMLVAHDHSDWTQVLGNALARLLRNVRRGKTLDLLFGWGVMEPRRSRRIPGDGVSIVRAAFEQGRLLELAGAIPKLAVQVGPTQEAVFTGDRGDVRYPQNEVGIANALLRWHRKIVAGLEAAPRDKGVRLRATTSVNLRSGPGASYPVVTMLDEGTELTPLDDGRHEGWIRVRAGAAEGWVAERFVAAPETVTGTGTETVTETGTETEAGA